MRYALLFVVIAALTAVSCSNDKWSVDGKVSDGAGKTLVLEASHNGKWYGLDSVVLDGGGRFEMSQAPTGYPDIYRLRLGGDMVYFPIDSLETVTLTASAGTFGTDYTLSGTKAAETLFEVDRKLAAAVKQCGEAALANDSLLKRELSGMLLGDPSGVVAYYIVNKRVGNTPVFNPENKRDLRIIGAVANAFVQFRPTDPRTAYLSQLYLSYRKSTVQAVDTIAVAETPLIDFELTDENGKSRRLSEIASHGKVVLLNFTIYDVERSPEYNRQLASIYNSLHDSGLEVVQVAIDDDQFGWAKSAKNLPWTTLYLPESRRAGVLMSYNVGQIPATFIIDRKGDLVERVDDIDQVRKAVGRYI